MRPEGASPNLALLLHSHLSRAVTEASKVRINSIYSHLNLGAVVAEVSLTPSLFHILIR
jgi:hypothetical protein